MNFANKAIEGIFTSALDMTHYTCDGCGQQAPIGTTSRVFWEFTVCKDCKALQVAGRLSFHMEGGWPTHGEQQFLHCSVCDISTASARYRVLDGITTQLSPNWETCRACLDEQAQKV